MNFKMSCEEMFSKPPLFYKNQNGLYLLEYLWIVIKRNFYTQQKC